MKSNRKNVEFACRGSNHGRGCCWSSGAAEPPPLPGDESSERRVKHVASPKSYGHGIGAGDVNGDGRMDILTPKGWLEAPADPRKENWTLHADWDSTGHWGRIFTHDVNGDKRMDIVTSMAHDYGVMWLEQGSDGKFVKRVIDDSWSQAHAMTLADLNGHGRMDLITGKRFMAHNGRDPGEKGPLGIYWYESMKLPDGKADWVKHVVDYSTRTGAGMQVAVADFDGGDPTSRWAARAASICSRTSPRRSSYHRQQEIMMFPLTRRALLAGLTALVALAADEKPVKQYTADELKEVLKNEKNLFFLDVREPKELQDTGSIEAT